MTYKSAASDNRDEQSEMEWNGITIVILEVLLTVAVLIKHYSEDLKWMTSYFNPIIKISLKYSTWENVLSCFKQLFQLWKCANSKWAKCWWLFHLKETDL